MNGTRRGRRTDGSGPVTVTAAVDRGRRLSQGSVVQASIRARLLGVPLLRLDATIVLAPAAITPSPSIAIGGGNSLTEAVRNINDGAEILAQVRRQGRG